MINRRRSGVRGTPAKVNANAGLAASDKVNSASVSDGSHESVYLGHASVANTYWYLEATPVLLRDIAVASEQLYRGEAA